MKASRKVLLITACILGAVLIAAVWNTRQFSLESIQAPSKNTAKERNADETGLVGETVSFLVTEGDRKKWKIIAQQAIYAEDRASAKLNDVNGVFFNAAGKPLLTFTAPKGQYTNENNAVTLSGGVVVQSVESETVDKDQSADNAAVSSNKLTAPTMVWDASSDYVQASGGVTLTFPNGQTQADRCKFSLDFSDVSFSGRVRSQLVTPD
ncbi:MAG: LPS export ABC transporter periplasmic protein LptC [Cyanobacteria bacterium P01_H01_bin.74]